MVNRGDRNGRGDRAWSRLTWLVVVDRGLSLAVVIVAGRSEIGECGGPV